MSRAFVKDDDDRPEEPIPVPERGPYYVFAGTDLAALDDERRERAHVVGHEKGVVGFGSRVTVVDEAGEMSTYELVNDEDADPLHAHVGMTSPLAVALLGKNVGKAAVWERPVGAARLKIAKVEP